MTEIHVESELGKEAASFTISKKHLEMLITYSLLMMMIYNRLSA
jgi:hypothetical protein